MPVVGNRLSVVRQTWAGIPGTSYKRIVASLPRVELSTRCPFGHPITDDGQRATDNWFETSSQQMEPADPGVTEAAGNLGRDGICRGGRGLSRYAAGRYRSGLCVCRPQALPAIRGHGSGRLGPGQHRDLPDRLQRWRAAAGKANREAAVQQDQSFLRAARIPGGNAALHASAADAVQAVRAIGRSSGDELRPLSGCDFLWPTAALLAGVADRDPLRACDPGLRGRDGAPPSALGDRCDCGRVADRLVGLAAA